MTDFTRHIDRNIPELERVVNFTQADGGVGDTFLVEASLGRLSHRVEIVAVAAMTVQLSTKQTVYPRRDGTGAILTSHLPLVAGVESYVADTGTIAIGAGETLVLDRPVADILIVTAAGNFTITAL